MLIGDPKTLAIEFGIMRAYERLSLRALGYFALHIGGVVFGVRTPDASILGCSYDGVIARLRRRGQHRVPFAEVPDAEELARAINVARYGPGEPGWLRFGYSSVGLDEILHQNGIWWAPDGDEAFDDGSRVVQFDVGSQVRVLGFKPRDLEIVGERRHGCLAGSQSILQSS